MEMLVWGQFFVLARASPDVAGRMWHTVAERAATWLVLVRSRGWGGRALRLVVMCFEVAVGAGFVVVLVDVVVCMWWSPLSSQI